MILFHCGWFRLSLYHFHFNKAIDRLNLVQGTFSHDFGSWQLTYIDMRGNTLGHAGVEWQAV